MTNALFNAARAAPARRSKAGLARPSALAAYVASLKLLASPLRNAVGTCRCRRRRPWSSAKTGGSCPAGTAFTKSANTNPGKSSHHRDMEPPRGPLTALPFDAARRLARRPTCPAVRRTLRRCVIAHQGISYVRELRPRRLRLPDRSRRCMAPTPNPVGPRREFLHNRRLLAARPERVELSVQLFASPAPASMRTIRRAVPALSRLPRQATSRSRALEFGRPHLITQSRDRQHGCHAPVNDAPATSR